MSAVIYNRFRKNFFHLLKAGAVLCAAISLLSASMVRAAQSAAQAMPSGDVRPEIRIGLIDTFSPEFYIDTYAPTVQYLKKRLPQYKFVSEEFSNPADLTKEAAGRLDFLVSSAGTYDIRAREFGAEHIVIRKRSDTLNAAQSVAAVFVVKSDNRTINRLSDLHHKSISATSATNFDGWLVAQDEIAQAGFDPDKFFSRVNFTEYNYPDVIGRVLAGQVDAGIVTRCELERLASRGLIDKNQLKVINAKQGPDEACVRSTDRYPGEVVSTFPHTDPSVTKDVTVALLLMPKRPSGSQNWEWVTVNDLVNISGLMERLSLGRFSYQRDLTVSALARRYSTEIFLVLALIAATIFHIVRVNALVRLRTRELVIALREKEALIERGKRTQDYLNLLERNQIVSQLSNLFAHEMKQPVTNILNYAAGLEMLNQRKNKAGQEIEKSDSTTVDRALKAITVQARRIADIVERVRAYAKHQPLAKTNCRLSDVISTMLKNFRLAKRSVSTIDVHVARDIFVTADPVALELLLLNLVRNAERAVSKLPDPRIRIQALVSDNRVRVTVSDNGPAVDESLFEELSKIGGVKSPHGLGMGLAIAKGIAENHNGHLEFSRSEGGGLACTLVMFTQTEKGDAHENTAA